MAGSSDRQRRLGTLLMGFATVGMIVLAANLARGLEGRRTDLAGPMTAEERRHLECCEPPDPAEWAVTSTASQIRRPVPEVLTGGEVSRGQRIFVSVCAGCHGNTTGILTQEEVLAFERSRDRSPTEIADTIVNGRGRMPGFGELLEPRELLDLVAFIEGRP